MTMVFLGIDLAKNVFALHGFDATGHPVFVTERSIAIARFFV